MEIRRSGCFKIQVSLKTEKEIGMTRGRVIRHSDLGTLEVSYYKFNIIGRMAACCGLAFKAIDQDTQTVYYLSTKDMSTEVAKHFGIVYVDKGILRRIFTATFTLDHGQYIFNRSFRMNLRTLDREIHQEAQDIRNEEERKRKLAEAEMGEKFDPRTGELVDSRNETPREAPLTKDLNTRRSCWQRLLARCCCCAPKPGDLALSRVVRRDEANEAYFS